MAVANLITAMRADIPPAARLVWQCLENHANGHGWWRLTSNQIAAELHLHLTTIKQSVRFLERLNVIRRQVDRRTGVTTFHMLWDTPDAEGVGQKESGGGVKKGPGGGSKRVRGVGLKESPCTHQENPPVQELAPACTFDSFSDWYSRYPRKAARRRAEAAYTRAIAAGATPAALLAGLERYRFSTDPDRQPHPATWLDEERWLDVPPAAPQSLEPAAEAASAPELLPPDAPPDPRRFLTRWIETRSQTGIDRAAQLSLIRRYDRPVFEYLLGADTEALALAENRWPADCDRASDLRAAAD